MGKIPIGVQLYSVRDDCALDLPGTIEAMARAGFSAVEFAGYYNRTANELRRLLQDLGLGCCGSHISLDTLLGDQLARTVEFNLELGNRFLIVPWIAEKYRDSVTSWQATGALFDEIAEKIAPHGLMVGYHHHEVEFHPFEGGELGMDVFYSASKRAIMQLDTAHALSGGADPVQYIRRYPGRAVTVHLRDYSTVDDRAFIGEGEVDWAGVFEACETVGGTEWYIVEQERYKVPPVEAVARCLESLHSMGK